MTSSYLKQRNRNQSGLVTGLIKYSAFLFIALSVMLASCDEDPANIGKGLLPDDDFISIYSTDTIKVRAYTMYNANLVSSDSTKMIAGGIYDAYFGDTHCDFVTQLRLIDSLRKSVINIDSVFLRFIPSAISGDTAAVHYIRIYETGTVLTDPDVYYTGQDPDTIKFLGEYPMPILKKDSSYSVRIDNSVAQYLFRDTAMFRPASKFYKEFFKGLYFGIRSETNPVLMTLTAADNPLAITIYYHAADTIARYYSFVATERAVNYNRFTHDRTTAEPEKLIIHVNDMVLDTAAYLQTFYGIYTRLEMPSLQAFRGTERIAVNKARIIAPVHIDGDTYLEKDMPAQILVRYRNSEGKEVAIPDMLHGLSFMDGTYKKDKASYVFNITSFVQQYLEGEIDNPSVELFFPLSAVKNVIFKANGNNPAFKLEFAYTIY
jgi:hypothetical protein